LVGLGHDGECRPTPLLPRRLTLCLAQALCVTGDGGIAPGIATLLQLAIQAQGIVTAGIPPFQEIGFVGIEDTVATVTAARALRQGGGAEIAKYRTPPDAQMGGNGMARPAVLPQRPPLLMALNPTGPPWGRLLLSGRWRGWNGDGAVRQGHPLTTDGVIDGGERRPVRMEHLLEAFHQILQEVKPISDLGGLGGPMARPIGIGSGPIARDDLYSRVGPQPLRQGLCFPIGQQGDRLPAFQIDQDGPIGLAFPEREIIDAQDSWRAVARERQAMDEAQEGLTAEQASQAPTEPHAGRPAQHQPDGDQPRDQAPRPPSPRGDDLGQPLRKDPTGALRVGADELADAELPPDTSGAPGQIGGGACIAAVDTRGEDSADRAGHDLLCGSHVQDQQRGGIVQVPSIKLKCGGLR
jgi:hypothetical protein